MEILPAEPRWLRPRLLFAGIMPQAIHSGKPRQAHIGPRFSAQRNDMCMSASGMPCKAGAFQFEPVLRVAVMLGSLVVAGIGPAAAAACSFAPQGEGRVVDIIDGRSFRLQDGREVRLAGIEPVGAERPAANRRAALAALVLGNDVTLRGEDDTPDRYGREPAFAFLDGVDTPVQILLLAEGEALLSGTVTDPDCAAALAAAEAAARQAGRGVWGDPTVIKNTERPGDILTRIGRFTVVEGRVLSVRQAGATTYLNFGWNWTRDFAVTIPKRGLAVFEAAGITLKSLEGRTIRVRGWVEAHGGPRIEAIRVGQIELLGRN